MAESEEVIVNCQPLPTIIQGGMGVGVSDWRLARAVALTGQLGVVSGTALDIVLARRLQLGDLGGHIARAIAQFPISEIARRVWDRFYVAGGKPGDDPFASCPLPSLRANDDLEELIVVANFAEVFLAKEGIKGIVGINYLEKIQLPTLPSLFGAILAGVDYVLMGAGIPKAIPGILDHLAAGKPAELKVNVTDDSREGLHGLKFDPVRFCRERVPKLRRPKFLAIIASSVLATMLTRRASGHVDGFVVEGATAGGHNAPPRGTMQLNERGEPIYGPRDVVDLAAIRALERPFWLAGGYAHPERLQEARAQGATGVQIGTPMAFCEESGIAPDLKRAVLEKCRTGNIEVVTDPVASPAGFPFKVVQLEGSLSDHEAYASRNRVCDAGLLREAFQKPDGSVGFRCPAEPEQQYVRKGGDQDDTCGRLCVCNGLLATVGLGQTHKDGEQERPLITAGDDLCDIARFLKPNTQTYHAADVIDYVLGQQPEPAAVADGCDGAE